MGARTELVKGTVYCRKGCDSRIVEFVKQQGNFSDAMIYLIEKEIAENGIRNLELCIPAKRNILKPLETSLNNNQQANLQVRTKTQVVELEQLPTDKNMEQIEVVEPNQMAETTLDKTIEQEQLAETLLTDNVEKEITEDVPLEEPNTTAKAPVPNCYDDY